MYNSQDRLDNVKYQLNLPLWDKYIIWMYTLGSSAPNKYMMGIPHDLGPWTYRFLRNFRYNFRKNYNAPYLAKYFRQPSLYISLNAKKQYDISVRLIKKFAIDLTRIILRSPALKHDLTLLKASSKYPGLEVGNNPLQQAFNSCTYRTDTDLNPFIGEDHCCLHKLSISKGHHVLFIASSLSAYTDEAEVLLHPGIRFDIYRKKTVQINRPVPGGIRYREIQDTKYGRVKIGNVYQYDHANNIPKAGKKQVTLYISRVTFK
ncbi:MAG: hypothetical protein GY751_11060 [Bacteroidetes bacterium]|nr:hypothetical protein [Bacteroidota bacterium]